VGPENQDFLGPEMTMSEVSGIHEVQAPYQKQVRYIGNFMSMSFAAAV
jgi:hypothetical protein